MSLNKVLLIGNVGKDPEVRHLESGAVTASFSLATNERYKDRNGEYRDQTEWHNIVCWRNTAEFAEKYVRKGSSLYIEGKIRNRQYQDKEGNTRYIVEIYADDIRFVGKRADNSPAEYQSGGYSAPSTPAQPAPIYTPASTPAQKPMETSFGTSSDDIGDDLPF